MGICSSSFEDNSDDDTSREITKIRNKIVRANKNIKDLKAKLKDDAEVLAMGSAIFRSIIQPCPICLEPMSEEIKLCLNGHSTCGRCVSHCASCPLCREPISEYRNIPMEGITKDILGKLGCGDENERISCANERFGCPLRYPKFVTDYHQKTCKYKSIPSCCGVILNYINFITHIRSEHSENFIMNGETITNTSKKLFLNVYDETFVLYRRKNSLSYYYNVYHLTLERERTYAFRLIIQNKELLADEGICRPCRMEDFINDNFVSFTDDKYAEIPIEEFHRDFDLEDGPVFETRLVIYSREI